MKLVDDCPEPLPCPFCGARMFRLGATEAIVHPNPSDETTPQCIGGSIWLLDREDIEAWNRRAVSITATDAEDERANAHA